MPSFSSPHDAGEETTAEGADTLVVERGANAEPEDLCNLRSSPRF